MPDGSIGTQGFRDALRETLREELYTRGWSILKTPVLSPVPGTWNKRDLSGPMPALTVGETYVMAFLGTDEPTYWPRSIGIATSPNGLPGTWKEQLGNPVLTSLLGYSFEPGDLIWRDDLKRWYLYLSVVSLPGDPIYGRVRLYSSPNLSPGSFTDLGDVLTEGAPGSYDEAAASRPTVWYSNRDMRWNMIYGFANPTYGGLAVAYSADGITWVKAPYNPVLVTSREETSIEAMCARAYGNHIAVIMEAVANNLWSFRLVFGTGYPSTLTIPPTPATWRNGFALGRAAETFLAIPGQGLEGGNASSGMYHPHWIELEGRPTIFYTAHHTLRVAYVNPELLDPLNHTLHYLLMKGLPLTGGVTYYTPAVLGRGFASVDFRFRANQNGTLRLLEDPEAGPDTDLGMQVVATYPYVANQYWSEEVLDPVGHMSLEFTPGVGCVAYAFAACKRGT